MKRKLTLNIDVGSSLLLEEEVAKHEPFVSEHAVALVALCIGLSELAEDPDLLKRELAKSARRRRHG